MKHLWLTLALLPSALFAQTTTTLEACYSAAETNYPLAGQSTLLQNITDANILKINAIWQPQIYISAQATYQSEVTSLPISIPGIEVAELSKDQYKATLDINQVLYDGGISAQQKAIAQQSLAVEQQKAEVDRYKLKDKVNQLYFAILMADERMQILTRTLGDIHTYIAFTQAAAQYGAASELQLLELKAQEMRVEQQVAEVTGLRKGAIAALNALTGLSLTETTSFTIPAQEVTTPALLRPELELFSRQQSLYTLQQQFAEKTTLPKVSLFAQGGYGRPGLNFLVDSFRLFYIGGIKVQYPLWAGNNKAQDAHIYKLNNELVHMQQLNFKQSISIQTAQYQYDIEKFNTQLSKDDSLITLLEMIITGEKTRFQEGVISTRDLLEVLAERDDAQTNLEIHRLQLLATKVNYLNTLGQL